jgi:hypothetical protein
LAKDTCQKDLAPHVEAQEKYDFSDVVDELTYWGVYYYDAVLAAAYALVATNNRLDGEDELKELCHLLLDNTNTGVLEMDANRDRMRARNPVFFDRSEGEAVQFALLFLSRQRERQYNLPCMMGTWMYCRIQCGPVG